MSYIAQRGVATPEVFRKPGNKNEIKRIEKLLNEGKAICIEDYNFFTLASFIKVLLNLTFYSSQASLIA